MSNWFVLCMEQQIQALSSDATGIRVRGCLAGLGVGTYLALAAMGLERIILRLDACEDCPWVSLQKVIQTQVELRPVKLLARWEKAETLVWFADA